MQYCKGSTKCLQSYNADDGSDDFWSAVYKVLGLGGQTVVADFFTVAKKDMWPKYLMEDISVTK